LYLTHVAAAIAEIKGVTVEEVYGQTTQNANMLFSIKGAIA